MPMFGAWIMRRHMPVYALALHGPDGRQKRPGPGWLSREPGSSVHRGWSMKTVKSKRTHSPKRRKTLTPAANLRLLSGRFTTSDYKLYLLSDQWNQKKLEALKWYFRACMFCGGKESLQVHHRPLGYKHLYREDVATQLSVVCERCHKRHHRK